jgi:hypothetical protein
MTRQLDPATKEDAAVGWIETFVDAVKKAAGKKPAVDMDVVRSSGGTLGSTPGAYADKFDPLKPAPAPAPESGKGVDTGAISNAGDLSVKSADPEEGGEIANP